MGTIEYGTPHGTKKNTEKPIILMSTEKTTADLDLRVENIAVFELVQLIGIASALCTCIVFLDPCIKSFLFINFLVDLGCVGRTVGPNCNVFTVFGFQK